MLKFLPRLVARRPNVPYYIQQVAVGYRADRHNCDYCYYKQFWTQDFTPEDCATKYQCQSFEQPYILVHPLHYDEIEDTMTTDLPRRKLYKVTRVTRQVKVKGWPLYLQQIACDDPQPQCNALCYFHNQRLQDKKTVAQCAHTHGCSRSGSFFDLLIPVDANIQQQFFDELNSMNP